MRGGALCARALLRLGPRGRTFPLAREGAIAAISNARRTSTPTAKAARLESRILADGVLESRNSARRRVLRTGLVTDPQSLSCTKPHAQRDRAGRHGRALHSALDRRVDAPQLELLAQPRRGGPGRRLPGAAVHDPAR